MKKIPLIVSRPDLAAQLHPTKNDGLSTQKIGADYRYKVWWFCNEGHEWQESPYSRCKRTDASCKVCEFSLAATHPKLLSLWHPTKNTDCTPFTITAKG